MHGASSFALCAGHELRMICAACSNCCCCKLAYLVLWSDFAQHITQQLQKLLWAFFTVSRHHYKMFRCLHSVAARITLSWHRGTLHTAAVHRCSSALPEADEGHPSVEPRLVQLINDVVYVSHVKYRSRLAHASKYLERSVALGSSSS
jgi:hypothetical protein